MAAHCGFWAIWRSFKDIFLQCAVHGLASVASRVEIVHQRIPRISFSVSEESAQTMRRGRKWRDAEESWRGCELSSLLYLPKRVCDEVSPPNTNSNVKMVGPSSDHWRNIINLGWDSGFTKAQTWQRQAAQNAHKLEVGVQEQGAVGSRVGGKLFARLDERAPFGRRTRLEKAAVDAIGGGWRRGKFCSGGSRNQSPAGRSW